MTLCVDQPAGVVYGPWYVCISKFRMSPPDIFFSSFFLPGDLDPKGAGAYVAPRHNEPRSGGISATTNQKLRFNKSAETNIRCNELKRCESWRSS